VSALTAGNLVMPAFRPRATATRRPWFYALFLCIVFFMANHNWYAASAWEETNSTDVSNLVSRMAEGQLSRQVAFVAMLGVGLVGIVLPSPRRMRVDLLILYPLLLLCAWCLLSILWSQAPMMTAKRFIVFFAMAATVLAIVRQFSLNFLVILSLCYGGMSLMLAVPAEILNANFSQAGYRFAGTMHPNHTGVCMVLLMLAALALADWQDRRRRWFFALAGVAFLVLLLTQSRTALLAGMFAAMVMTVLRWPLRRLLLVGLPILWIILVGGTLYSLELIPPIWQDAINMNRQDADATTLTGRTDIWKFALGHLTNDETRLLIGFGYDTFWTPEMARAVSKFVQFKISEGHSAYIDATLETGLIGASLYVFCLYATFFRWCWYAWKTKAAVAAFAAAIPAFAMVHGFAESATVDAHTWTLLLFACIAFAGLAKPNLNKGTLSA